MTSRSWVPFVVLGVALAGCGAGTDLADSANPSDFDAVDTAEARATSWERLVGAWEPTGAAQYAHLVFLRTADGTAHRYFGQRVVTCVRAPCNPVREDGNYTAGSSTLTLRSGDATQRLRYTLVREVLTITSGTTVLGRYHRATSYCAAAADCTDQGLAQPRCIGAYSCEANACVYHCATGPSCSAVRCASGTHCEMVGGAAVCLANVDPCATVRCASGTHCVASGTTASCVADGGGYGATCGGIAGLRCATGFSCVLAGTYPDASGICHPLSGLGGPCGGGSTRYPAVCETGLRCVGPAPGAPPGAMGVCQR